MSTLRRITAARANGSLSRGPTTRVTRAISAVNAISHGLTGRTAKSVVLSNESRSLFQQLLDDYLLRFYPRDSIETDLVEQMAVSTWRQHRLWSIETAALDLEMDRQDAKIREEFGATADRANTGDRANIDEPTRQAVAFKSLSDESTSLHLLTRYEGRLRHAFERALLTLQFLQSQPDPGPHTPDQIEPNPTNEQFLERAA